MQLPNDILSTGGSDNRTFLEEDDFSLVPPDTIIYTGDLPFKTGDKFPTDSMREWANVYKTNRNLYERKLGGVYSKILFDYTLQNDFLTNTPILHIIPNLPYYTICTDTWVGVLAQEPPKIDGKDSKKIKAVSEVMTLSNADTAYRNIVRDSIVMYGVHVNMIEKLKGGNLTNIEIPLKNWQPLMNKKDISTIDINLVFNITYSPEHGHKIAELMYYHEDGKIEKEVFEYLDSGTLGEKLRYEEDEALDGLGISPITVFTGERVGNSARGQDMYRNWDSAISNYILAYKNLAKQGQRLNEIHRIVPENTTEKDLNTGATYLPNHGVITYNPTPENPNAPDVKVVVPDTRVEQAIKICEEAFKRLCRDTDIPPTMFDPSILSSGNLSSKTLKVAMHKMESTARSKNTLLRKSTKEWICKMAAVSGIELSPADLTIDAENAFVRDEETLTEIIQKRNGGQATLSLEDAIAKLDNKPMHEALTEANKLRGIPNEETDEEVVLTSSGGDSEVTDLSFTLTSTDPGVNIDEQQIEKTVMNSMKRVFHTLLGGMDIGKKE